MHPQRLTVVVVLTGAPGAGKTSVLTALSDRLAARDVPHRAIDLDALTWTHPPSQPPPNAVAVLLQSHDLALVAAASLHALDLPPEAFVVELTAPPDVLRERLTQREPPGWPGLASLIAAAESFGPVADPDLTIATNRTTPAEAAAMIDQTLNQPS